jgi:hypothetical protein
MPLLSHHVAGHIVLQRPALFPWDLVHIRERSRVLFPKIRLIQLVSSTHIHHFRITRLEEMLGKDVGTYMRPRHHPFSPSLCRTAMLMVLGQFWVQQQHWQTKKGLYVRAIVIVKTTIIHLRQYPQQGFLVLLCHLLMNG